MTNKHATFIHIKDPHGMDPNDRNLGEVIYASVPRTKEEAHELITRVYKDIHKHIMVTVVAYDYRHSHYGIVEVYKNDV